MKKTAIEEFIEYFQNTANVTFTGDKVVDYSISKLYYLQTLKVIFELKAKHEEEREQAVIEGIKYNLMTYAETDASDMHGHEQNIARQYYEANFKTKEQ